MQWEVEKIMSKSRCTCWACCAACWAKSCCSCCCRCNSCCLCSSCCLLKRKKSWEFSFKRIGCEVTCIRLVGEETLAVESSDYGLLEHARVNSRIGRADRTGKKDEFYRVAFLKVIFRIMSKCVLVHEEVSEKGRRGVVQRRCWSCERILSDWWPAGLQGHLSSTERKGILEQIGLDQSRYYCYL